MKTALTQYIEDLKTGNCKGEEYYFELEKQQIIKAHGAGGVESIMGFDTKKYYNETFNQKEK